MYVMQSLPSHQQSLAGGIFNTLIRLGSTVALGISTAVYGSAPATSQGLDDHMLRFQRAFQVSVGLAAASIIFLPFLRLGTQGNTVPMEEEAQDQPSSEPIMSSESEMDKGKKPADEKENEKEKEISV
jgi:hypothetical protein